MTDPIVQWTRQLNREYDQILYTYRLKLLRPIIEVKSMSSRWGFWDSETRVITLSVQLIKTFPWEVVLQVLKHEMAHQYVFELNPFAESHGSEFLEACTRLGVAEWASASQVEIGETLSTKPDAHLSDGDRRILSRVEKLLLLASSSNEHEALAAMNKVREIQLKHNIEKIQLNEKGYYAQRTIKTQKKRLERYQYILTSLLNEHFFVEVIFATLYDAEKMTNYKVIELFGTEENVQLAEYVYFFLSNQARLSWEKYRSDKLASRRDRNSFLVGVISGFRKKLEQSQTKAQHEMGLVVLKDPELGKFVKTQFPRLIRLNDSSPLSSHNAYSAGSRAGEKIILHKGVKNSNQGPIRIIGKLLKG